MRRDLLPRFLTSKYLKQMMNEKELQNQQAMQKVSQSDGSGRSRRNRLRLRKMSIGELALNADARALLGIKSPMDEGGENDPSRKRTSFRQSFALWKSKRKNDDDSSTKSNSSTTEAENSENAVEVVDKMNTKK